MPGSRRNRAGTALPGPAKRNAMGMWSWLVAKNVVEQVLESLEHMFDSLRTGTDGLQDSLQGCRRVAAEPEAGRGDTVS